MKRAVFPGSFDPFTLGHLDIVKRAASIFDEVCVCVLVNPDKKAMFTADERADMIRAAVADEGLDNVLADSFTGLTVAYAGSIGAGYMIRGLRSASDFEYESRLEAMNRLLAPGIATVYLMADPGYVNISSSAVRELIHYGADIGTLVPDKIYRKIAERVNSDEQ